MTQEEDEVKRIVEMNALFMTLDERGKDGALTVLRSLKFAQSLLESSEKEKPPRRSSKNRPA